MTASVKLLRAGVFLATMMAASAGTAAPLAWTDWRTVDPATGATGTLAGVAVGVEARLINWELSGPSNDTWWEFLGNPWSAYAALPNRPQDRDVIAPGAGLVTIQFARPVRDPVLAILSLGQQADPSLDVEWAFDRPFILGGRGLSVFGEGVLEARPGNILYGAEGSGWIRFEGTHSSISFVMNKDENWSGFTIGGVIPEPASWALFLCGFASIGLAVRRRRPMPA